MAHQSNNRPVPQPWPLQRLTGIDPTIADNEDVLLYARLGVAEATEHKARLEGLHSQSREKREALLAKWRLYFQSLDALLRLSAQRTQQAESKRHHERLEELDQEAKEAHAAYETQRLGLDALRYGEQLRLEEASRQGNQAEMQRHHERMEELDQQAKQAHTEYEQQRFGLEAMRYGEQLRIQEASLQGNLAEAKRHHERQEELDKQAREAHALNENNRLQLDALRYGLQYQLDGQYKQGMLNVAAQRNQLAGNHDLIVERQQWGRLQEEGRHNRQLEDHSFLRVQEDRRHHRQLELQGWLRRGSCLIPLILLILFGLGLCVLSTIFMTWTRW